MSHTFIWCNNQLYILQILNMYTPTPPPNPLHHHSLDCLPQPQPPPAPRGPRQHLSPLLVIFLLTFVPPINEHFCDISPPCQRLSQYLF